MKKYTSEKQLLKYIHEAKMCYQNGETKKWEMLTDLIEDLEDARSIEERKHEKTIPFKGSFKASFINA